MEAGATSATPVVGAAASAPAMLLRQALERGSEAALREKAQGRWSELSWAQYAQRAAQVGLALAELGIRPGDRVAIHADNRAEWVIADLGIQGIGAVSVGIDAACPASEAAHVLAHSGARVLLVDEEERLGTARAARDRLPGLERVVTMEPGAAGDPGLSELVAAVPARNAVEDWTSHVLELDPASVATLVYTRGGAEPPPAAMLTHANLAWAAEILREALGAGPDDTILSREPLTDIAERLVTLGVAVGSGCRVSFGAVGSSVLDDLRDAKPTIFAAPPGVWEELSGPRRAGRPSRRRSGLGRLRAALHTAGPVAREAVERLGGLGVELRELYGATESTSACALAPPGEARPGSVGRVLAGVEVRILPDDEILVRSPGVFAGYFRDEPATRRVIDPSGWLHTGDRGMFDVDGHLTVTSRRRPA